MTTPEPEQPAAGRSAEPKCTCPDFNSFGHEPGCPFLAWRAAAAEHETRESHAEPRSSAAHGSAPFVATPLTPNNVGQAARAAANEAIIDMWREEIEMVEAWLQETHPELINDTGLTCWGVLVGRLYDIKAQNAKLIERPDGAPELEPACEAASMQRLARRSTDKSGAPDAASAGSGGVGGDSKSNTPI